MYTRQVAAARTAAWACQRLATFRKCAPRQGGPRRSRTVRSIANISRHATKAPFGDRRGRPGDGSPMISIPPAKRIEIFVVPAGSVQSRLGLADDATVLKVAHPSTVELGRSGLQPALVAEKFFGRNYVRKTELRVRPTPRRSPTAHSFSMRVARRRFLTGSLCAGRTPPFARLSSRERQRVPLRSCGLSRRMLRCARQVGPTFARRF